MRNLDVTTLRSFVAVADLGGVTKAAGFLHLTQSAVSMQLKRLEELIGVSLLDRSGRGIALTPAGEQLLGYARRMVSLNDEVIRRLTHEEFEGEITLGVPHDIVYPVIPRAMQQFAAAYPRVKVHLISSYTRALRSQFDKGECDLILTTEAQSAFGAELLCTLPMAWVGAPGGATWRRRPFRFASGANCVFRSNAIRALDEVGIEWEMAVETNSERTVEATVSADLGAMAMIEGTQPPYLEVIEHNGALPDLGVQNINLYGAEAGKGDVIAYLADLLRKGFHPMQGRYDIQSAHRRHANAGAR
ncbi:LysR family transcriptional regulator [Shimia thalassica]|jgi:DNA-binding transcriptional LysR family regulator|uniref:HTH-type transcriptional regulator YofA n=1 Tax=Shimia thalassica TaxID=1715693 RepID=A0A0P1I2Y2_9RHOB|nr:LysR family transcriptional regulator [Shimia thalassica]PHO02918.1 LysR family transcriptional regulator [Rhodobacteraceae bacterium 4F10]MBU2943040.1 LysR family transcriptional regulator [Shimia thalassica]MDO6479094.1 LysR family transcriptional regulator [Shimia thalassica]MDO6482137.1 LysR family transcriptional regulator [Shimia thalassica]MDO6502637.1 LysR family transcriptional regulator [Shimia thalassica]